MKILLNLNLTDEGYLAKIDELPDFSTRFSQDDTALESLPSALKKFTIDWEKKTEAKTAKYQEEFPIIQRIKSRSFYQATLYRIQEIVKNNQSKQIDLELIHSVNQTAFASISANKTNND